MTVKERKENITVLWPISITNSITTVSVILGSSYCSGYVDLHGAWSPGFYCPYNDDSVDVFCCGSVRHKYCCTKEEDMVQEEEEG